MGNKKLYLAVVFVFSMFFFLQAAAAQTVRPGDKAPDFSVKLSTGERVGLSDFKDGALLLHFWATWCPPCRMELPELDRLAVQLASDRNRKLDFLAVCVSDDESSRAKFMEKNGYSFAGALDAKGDVARLYGINGIPASIIIQDGIVRKVVVGAMTKTQLSAFVSEYVSF